MKVGSVNPIISQYTKIQSAAPAPAAKPQFQRDEVQLSHDARVFSEAFSAARRAMQAQGQGSEIRAEEILRRMQGGEYGISTGELCDKLLAC